MQTVTPELAKQLGVSQDTVVRAVQVGTIRGRRVGPRSHRVSSLEVEYLNEAWPFIWRLRAALRTEKSVATAILFGSRARGDSRPSSDVDIALVLRSQAAPEGTQALRDRLSQRLGLPVDLYLYDGLRPSEKLEVLEQGRPIVDRIASWPRLQRTKSQLRRQEEASLARYAGFFEVVQ